jgi:hypothetical protein
LVILVIFLFLDYALRLVVRVPDDGDDSYSSVVNNLCEQISNLDPSHIDFLKEDNKFDIYTNALYGSYPNGDNNIYLGADFYFFILFKNKDEPTCPTFTPPVS